MDICQKCDLIRRCLMRLGSESKAGGTSGLDFVFRLGICLFFLAPNLSAQTTAPDFAKRSSGQRVLPGHVPAGLERLTPVGELPATQRLDLAISLPVRNPDRLQ